MKSSPKHWPHFFSSLDSVRSPATVLPFRKLDFIRFAGFPPFWVFGALMLIPPLRSPDRFSPLSGSSAWLSNPEFMAWYSENIRTEEDKIAFLTKMHEVEMK